MLVRFALERGFATLDRQSQTIDGIRTRTVALLPISVAGLALLSAVDFDGSVAPVVFVGLGFLMVAALFSVVWRITGPEEDGRAYVDPEVVIEGYDNEGGIRAMAGFVAQAHAENYILIRHAQAYNRQAVLLVFGEALAFAIAAIIS